MTRTRARPVEEEADEEFLGLSDKTRWAIDQAFDRGLRQSQSKGKGKGKAKAVELSFGQENDAAGGHVSGGGFMDEGGDLGGGFLPDDEGGFLEEDGGGFLPDDDDVTSPQTPPRRSPLSPPPASPATTTAKIPLRLIPHLLTLLHLPTDDDILAVFRASASGWDDSAKRSRPGPDDEQELGVERKDFRAVCAALMGGDEGEGRYDALEEDASEEGQDAYELPSEEDESSLSSLSGSEYGGESSKGKGKRKAPAKVEGKPKRPRKSKKEALREDDGPVRLTSRQREVVRDIWSMLKPKAEGRGANVLGREEVKACVRSLGEMWTEEEITEMVTLFSKQHEGRGLSFDDLGAIMVRSGLC